MKSQQGVPGTGSEQQADSQIGNQPATIKVVNSPQNEKSTKGPDAKTQLSGLRDFQSYGKQK